jgi:UDP-sugar pyrophosphorylase
MELFESIRVSLGGSIREDSSTWPEGLRKNEPVLALESWSRWYAVMLLDCDQGHLFENWDDPGVNDEKKLDMLRQTKLLYESYPGGLPAYIKLARSLLHESGYGVNCYDNYVASVPRGISLDPSSKDFMLKEKIGLDRVAKCGFVLVAGESGERLGYNGSKLELPTESTTGTSYMELYCKQILAIQNRYCDREMVSRYGYVSNLFLPIAIMTSDDTHDRIEEYLMSHDYFGLDSQQVTLLKQEKVAALIDEEAHVALVNKSDEEGKYVIDTKLHGHGDIHALMYSSQTAYKWQRELNTEWIVFMQDTNGLGILSLPTMLANSVEMELVVNSAAVPRVAKQDVEAITCLRNEDTGKQLTVSVEYNQLGQLVTNAQNPEGDTNDPATGYSKFPGNINQLVIGVKSYLDTLYNTGGRVGEFVNPKYEAGGLTRLAEPTCLECVMQDFPKLLESPPHEESARVGFTQYPAWAAGLPAGSAWSAESGLHYAQAQMLRILGVKCAKAPPVTFRGVTASGGPMIVIKPSTAIFMSELRGVFPIPHQVTISQRSSLILDGDVIVEELNLDGALEVKAVPGTKVIVRACNVANAGLVRRSTESWGALLSPIKPQYREMDQVRGYHVYRLEEEVVSTAGMAGERPDAVVAPRNGSYGDSNEEETKIEGGGNENTRNSCVVYYYTGHGNLIPASMYDDASKREGLCSHCAFRSCCNCIQCA